MNAAAQQRLEKSGNRVSDAAIREKEAVPAIFKIDVRPDGTVWPSSRFTITMDKTTMSIKQGALISDALDLIDSIAVSDRGQRRRRGAVPAVHVETSPLVAVVDMEQGVIHSKRTDLHVYYDDGGNGGNGGGGSEKRGRLPWSLHLVTWGTASVYGSGDVDMTLAIPGDALQSMLGSSSVMFPDDFGIPIKLKGTVVKPEVKDMWTTSKELGKVLLKARAKSVLPWWAIDDDDMMIKYKMPKL